MRIIIIGGSGLIGSCLFNLLKKNNHQVIATYCANKTKNMIKFNMLEQKISDVIPNINDEDIFIIMSALNKPSWVFQNKELSYKMNVSSTIDLINQLIKFKSKIYFMSSVEIFDGKEGNYIEKSKPNPLNYYGKTKVLVEEYLKNNCQNYTILRTGWNVGISKKNKCVVNLTYETLLSEEAKMAFDNSFSITHVEDLCASISKILFNNDVSRNDILHLSSSLTVRRTELADFIIEHSKRGKDMTYKKVPFSDIKYSEPRGKLNNLKSQIKFVNENIKFRSPYETILEKVKFLDNLL